MISNPNWDSARYEATAMTILKDGESEQECLDRLASKFCPVHIQCEVVSWARNGNEIVAKLREIE